WTTMSEQASVSSDGIRRLWTKLAVNNIEETRMNPEFIELVERYDTYKQCADALIDRLETCLQQNQAVIIKGKVDAEPGENPYEKLASSLALFYTYLPTDRHASIIAAISASKINGRKAIRHLRRFFAIEYKQCMDERTKLDKSRNHMDHIKHEVKMSKTTEKIEKYATLYEQAVSDFDAQANRVLIKLNQLPKIKLA
uniref:BAR domain-containing protein n=1 Tax=Parascaris univalens TaxID=6257 RepID=A0A914ZXN9_PARUN